MLTTNLTPCIFSTATTALISQVSPFSFCFHVLYLQRLPSPFSFSISLSFTTLFMLGRFYSAAGAGTSLIVGVFTRLHFECQCVCAHLFVHVFLDMYVCVCLCLQTFLYSAWLSNLFWFCLVSRTRSQLPFKGQIWAKWAALSYRGNRLNKALCLHHLTQRSTVYWILYFCIVSAHSHSIDYVHTNTYRHFLIINQSLLNDCVRFVMGCNYS